MKTLILAVIIYQLFIQAVLGMFIEGISVVRVAIDFMLYGLAIYIALTKDIKLNRLLLPYLFLILAVALSFIVNQNEIGIGSFIKQIRFTFIGLALYILMSNLRFTKSDFDRLLKILFNIGYIQLPIVAFQLFMFDSHILKNTPADYVDAGTGTVGFMDSGVTGMYLVMLLIIKFQKAFDVGLSKKDVLQIILLAAPLGLINSDAQFFFLPLIIVFALYLNFKFNKKTFSYLFSIALLALITNQLLLFNWSGDRDISKYITSKIYHLENTEANYDSAVNRMLRYDSMRFVTEETDHDDWLLGNGSGYWLTRDSEGGESSISNVWYHANTLLLSYGELGLIGLLSYIFFPIILYYYADKSFWGRVLKIEAVYIFLLLFYQHPLNKLSTVIVLMLLISLYRAEKKQVLNVELEQTRNKSTSYGKL